MKDSTTTLMNLFSFDNMRKPQANPMTVAQVWAALDAGKTVFWGGEYYTVIVETIGDAPDFVKEYQTKHHTHRNGQVLSIRCTANYFGGLMAESEVDELFVK